MGEVKSREWTVVRGECASGGELNELCNLVATSQGNAKIDVVQQRLSCGCVLILADSDGTIL